MVGGATILGFAVITRSTVSQNFVTNRIGKAGPCKGRDPIPSKGRIRSTLGQSKDLGNARHAACSIMHPISLETINMRHIGHDDIPLIDHHAGCKQSKQDGFHDEAQNGNQIGGSIQTSTTTTTTTTRETTTDGCLILFLFRGDDNYDSDDKKTDPHGTPMQKRGGVSLDKFGNDLRTRAFFFHAANHHACGDLIFSSYILCIPRQKDASLCVVSVCLSVFLSSWRGWDETTLIRTKRQ
mmetsp:Transcript_17436/g.40513  ORF Transcript_17436/g.40513 Transcript_17436/m.40513 type:complete len:239 (-) Transcript_17436:97-813(-)